MAKSDTDSTVEALRGSKAKASSKPASESKEEQKKGHASESSVPEPVKGGGLVNKGADSFFGKGGILTALTTGDFCDRQTAEEILEASMENVDASEIKIPRLSLMQPLSPQAVGRDAKFKAGQVIDNVDNVLLSREVNSPWLAGKVPGELQLVDAVLIIPIFKLPTEFIKWKDRKTEGRGMHWKTLDRRDGRVRDGCWPPHGRWQAAPDAEKRSPPVTVNSNFAVMVIDSNDVTVLSELCIATFSKTSSGAGSDLTTKITRAMRRQVPIFGMSYWLWVKEEHNEKSNSTYYIFKVAQGKSIIELYGEKVTAVASKLLGTFNEFANKETGRAAQEGLLNASSIDDGDWDDSSTDGSESVNTVNSIDVAADDAASRSASEHDEPAF